MDKMPLLFLSLLWSCNSIFEVPTLNENPQRVRIGFYNLENFFDYFDDTLKNDEDFTPMGSKAWGKQKYESKCSQLFKVIAALGADTPIAFLGLCEVENEKVLRDLCFGTPLRQAQFNFIHYESNDPRGIDVALLYRKRYFKPLYSRPISIIYPPDTSSFTRDILYVNGLLAGKDSVHIFVNHFPSKYGGASATISKRAFTANILRQEILKIYAESPRANIIVIGDFNDEPSDASIVESLGSKCAPSDNIENPCTTDQILINLMCRFIGKQGSNKFRSEWSIIDQIMLSPSLYFGTNKLMPFEKKAYVFAPEYLLMRDDIYMGMKTFRTYNGMKYLGGYSDHLAVYLDFIWITDK